MKTRIKRFIFILLYIVHSTIYAQPPHAFTQYTAKDMPEQKTISCIIQDKKGFLWLATWDGVWQFDGRNFRHYRNNRTEKLNYFVGNRIFFMMEDKYGYIWLHHYNKHISRLDPNREQITSISEEELLIDNLFTLSNGHTWLVDKNQGLLLVETNETDKSLQIQYISKKYSILAGKKVNRVQDDSEGNEWILTESGLYKYTGNEVIPIITDYPVRRMIESESALFLSSINKRIWKCDKKDYTFKEIQLPAEANISVIRLINEEKLFCGTSSDGFFVMEANEPGWKHYTKDKFREMPDNGIRRVYIDKKQEVWIQQLSEGITHFDPKSDKITHFVLRDKEGKPIHGGYHYQNLLEDSSGNLYVHPNGGGFAYYDRAKKKLIPLYNKQLMDGWQSSDMITTAFMDRQNNIWLSSRTYGLEKISFNTIPFNLYTPTELQKEQLNSRALFTDRNQRLWIGFADAGVGVYDVHHHFLGYLQPNGSLSYATSKLKIDAYSIAEDYEGTIWIGTKEDGVIALKANQKSNTFTIKHFKHDKKDIYSINTNYIWQIKEDNKQRLWITTRGQGINYVEKKADGSYRFINSFNDLKQYPTETCGNARSIAFDRKGNGWIGTPDGLLRFDENFQSPSRIVFEQIKNISGNDKSLSNNDIQYICHTSKDELYLATFGGLNKLINKNGAIEFKSYTTDDGLLSNVLLSMTEDAGGNLWISMVDGLSKFFPANERFENYSTKDFPFSMRFNEGEGYYWPTDSMMLFNTNLGVLSFNPASVYKSSFVPPIVFTQLQLGNQIISPNDVTGILKENIDETSQIVLSHKQNSFSIHFAALDMTDSQNIIYEYRLKGFEDIWHKDQGGNYANYTNIPRGNYILEVRSTNSDQIWVDNTRSLAIRILPSFWESPWGIALYFVLGIIVLLAVFIYLRLKQRMHIEQRLSELKLRFFTDISHELRTPLTLITSPVKNVLERTDLPIEVQEQLHLVDRNTNRMSNLINQILDFRKIENNKLTLQVQSIDLLPFIRQSMESFRLLAEEHQIPFSLESKSDNITLWADGDKLEKMIFNLLSNAFKYTPDGKEIKIIAEENTEEIQIKVQDQGAGIPQDMQKLLFERFASHSRPQNVKQASSGIGLSLVKELVEIHKGTVSIYSVEMEGTTVTLSFKKGKSHFDADTVFISSDEKMPDIYQWKEDILTNVEPDDLSVASEAKENDQIILIVEDNQELRQFLRIALCRIFSHIVEATNGEEGLEKAKTAMPDLIISDIMMPKKDGIELLHDLRKDITVSHIPVILLTAKATIEDRIKGIELGAEDYIPKPFSIAYLKVRILNILERRKRLQEYYHSSIPNKNESLLEEAQQELVNTITSNDQLFMKRLLENIYKHIDNGDLTIEELSREVGMSRPVFFNKVKNLTGVSPIEFLRDIRLQQAEKLMTTDLTVSQIAFQVGFNDADYFGKCFKQKFGKTPSEYRKEHV